MQYQSQHGHHSLPFCCLEDSHDINTNMQYQSQHGHHSLLFCCLDRLSPLCKGRADPLPFHRSTIIFILDRYFRHWSALLTGRFPSTGGAAAPPRSRPGPIRPAVAGRPVKWLVKRPRSDRGPAGYSARLDRFRSFLTTFQISSSIGLVLDQSRLVWNSFWPVFGGTRWFETGSIPGVSTGQNGPVVTFDQESHLTVPQSRIVSGPVRCCCAFPLLVD